MAYCASCITGSSEAGNDQDTYIRALQKTESLDHVEFGNFVARVNIGPLAVEGPNRRPSLVDPSQLQVVGDTPGIRITSDRVLVSYSRREEKGSDVNVASHLLIDVFDARIDAALVVSNDSDLEFAVRRARSKMSVDMEIRRAVVSRASSKMMGSRGYPAIFRHSSGWMISSKVNCRLR